MPGTGHLLGLTMCFSRKVPVIPIQVRLPTALDNRHHRLPLEITNSSVGLQLDSSSQIHSYISFFSMFLVLLSYLTLEKVTKLHWRMDGL